MDQDDCLFCGLLGDRGTAAWVSREPGAAAVALLPLPDSSLAPGHTLVLPAEHCVGVHDASPRALHAVADLVQRVARAMTNAFGADGVNVLNASGPASGQSVPHLHVHVVPRWPADGLDTWPTSLSQHEVRGDIRARLADTLSTPATPEHPTF
ncbi:HIT domain-containing protein [Brachybacterium halotolerans subsp. kimchii]|uniref:HIT domain-containing protein n=1 Tax=Brachybacterium halotolerans TaxID=2795215 RepID=UPI001E47D634|nr:HIT domain-containing protein [Brachybacterium halotolerans]UEJ81269.1 HIT domain-containing protein [Brachybacterium halotolerans subsp. kimchii]